MTARLGLCLVICCVAGCDEHARASGEAPRAAGEVTATPAPATPSVETPEAPPAEPLLEPPSEHGLGQDIVPSSADVPAGCPPAARWPEGMACVPGGTFAIGDAEGDEDERPPGEVRVPSFYLDVYEVTNERYEACVARGACPRAMQRYRGFGRPRQPVVAVSWEGARRFCADAGSRLPTDAEHERAARGPDNAPYAFGADVSDPCAHAVIKTRAGEGCGTGVTADVGSRPAGHYGVHDLAGNVHEWASDRWAQCLRGCRRECGDACFGDAPRGPCGGAEGECPGHPLRSIRGGSWYWGLEHARAAARRGAPPANEGGHRFGFRCARDVVLRAP